jgi:hypothetical protein
VQLNKSVSPRYRLYTLLPAFEPRSGTFFSSGSRTIPMCEGLAQGSGRSTSPRTTSKRLQRLASHPICRLLLARPPRSNAWLRACGFLRRGDRDVGRLVRSVRYLGGG